MIVQYSSSVNFLPTTGDATDKSILLFSSTQPYIGLIAVSAALSSMLNFFGLFSAPDPLKPVAAPAELKKRLDWGEPALTIIDIRSREAFSRSHITGAASIPDAALIETVSASLEVERDIYIYGNSDEQTSQAAYRLREAGYRRVAELEGGLPAWEAIKGSVETSRGTIA